MAVRKRDELMQSLKDILKETDDDTLELLEDIEDTIKAGESGAEWEQKYKDNDAAWRQKYHDRFFGAPENAENEETVNQNKEEKKNFDDLFTAEEK